MKKLLFVATAALCATVFGAIQSTNVVGYQGNTANANRQTMMAPTFLSVGSETGCTLADLKVVGYEAAVWNTEDEEYNGGCIGGQFVLQFLNSNGSVAAAYYWIDNGEVSAGWYADEGATVIDGGAASVQIPAGTALWVIGTGKTLQSAGAVNKEDVAYVTNSSRQTAVGNSMPVELTLADLTVTGYAAAVWNTEDEEYNGGCIGGQFVLQFLNPNGSVAAAYCWIDNGEVPAGWYADEGAAAIEGGAASVKIPAGKGMWVIGTGKTLNIPAPEL